MKAKREPFTRTKRPAAERFSAAWWRRAVPPDQQTLFDGLVEGLRTPTAAELAKCADVAMTCWTLGIVDRALRGESPRGDTLSAKERRKLQAARRDLERERDALVASLGLKPGVELEMEEQ